MLPPVLLRLIIVGHNPSNHAWRTGHYYSNPTNWMWRILRETGIAPPSIRGAENDGLMPEVAEVGFTDVGSGVAGTHSAAFTPATLAAWRDPFFQRLQQHVAAAAAARCDGCLVCAAPTLLAFSGRRQFQELFLQQPDRRRGPGQSGRAGTPVDSGGGASMAGQALPTLSSRCPAAVTTGRQWVLPLGWPLPLDRTEVWVVPSTSGAAAMTREERMAPWRALAARLVREAPRRGGCRCQPGRPEPGAGELV